MPKMEVESILNPQAGRSGLPGLKCTSEAAQTASKGSLWTLGFKTKVPQPRKRRFRRYGVTLDAGMIGEYFYLSAWNFYCFVQMCMIPYRQFGFKRAKLLAVLSI